MRPVGRFATSSGDFFFPSPVCIRTAFLQRVQYLLESLGRLSTGCVLRLVERMKSTGGPARPGICLTVWVRHVHFSWLSVPSLLVVGAKDNLEFGMLRSVSTVIDDSLAGAICLITGGIDNVSSSPKKLESTPLIVACSLVGSNGRIPNSCGVGRLEK